MPDRLPSARPPGVGPPVRQLVRPGTVEVAHTRNVDGLAPPARQGVALVGPAGLAKAAATTASGLAQAKGMVGGRHPASGCCRRHRDQPEFCHNTLQAHLMLIDRGWGMRL